MSALVSYFSILNVFQFIFDVTYIDLSLNHTVNMGTNGLTWVFYKTGSAYKFLGSKFNIQALMG